jgi:hypothetical protein
VRSEIRAGEGHAHRPVPEQGGDGFEAHGAVDRLGGERVAQLVGVDVTDAGSLGGCCDVASDGAPLEGLAVVALDESSRARRWPSGEPVGDEFDEQRVQRDVAVVVELADGMRSQWVSPMRTMASDSSAASSPARMPVRANSSTMSRRRLSGSVASAAMNFAAVGSSRNFGSGSSHPNPLHRAEGAEPARQVVITGRGSGQRLDTEQATHRVDRCSDVDIEAAVHTPTIGPVTSTMDICHPFLCNWVQGVARTSREGDRDEQAVGAASSITLPNGACLVGAGDRSHTHQQPGGSHTCWPSPVSLGNLRASKFEGHHG